MSKKSKILFILVPFVLFAIVIAVVYKKPFEISTKGNGKLFNIKTYTDIDKGGNSTISLNENNNAISYTYKLGDSIKYPYTGIMINLKDTSFIDLSAYTDCSVSIKTKEGNRIPFYIFTYIDNFSDWNEIHSFFIAQYTLFLKGSEDQVTIKIKDFIIPNWWYSLHNKSVNDFDGPDFSKVAQINIANGTQIESNVEDTIEISSIKFYVSLIPYYICFAIFIITYTFSLFLYVRIKKKQKEKKEEHSSPIFTYTKIETQNNSDRESELIFSYINTNYPMPELTITDVRNETNISERKISAIIKDKTSLNFKQFLNSLRISEAKRLLKETDLQISEIAYKTGYSNTSHFNRVFKNSENISPGNYRKNM